MAYAARLDLIEILSWERLRLRRRSEEPMGAGKPRRLPRLLSTDSLDSSRADPATRAAHNAKSPCVSFQALASSDTVLTPSIRPGGPSIQEV
jgi:hypothetical protein